ncbi:MAG: bifunctional DNA-formamidopyrimidine glycosylase/DNA-(apurinic or apyrimidinic site) lyase [Phycisphaerales bacterium]
MPELPEVETVRRSAERFLLGKAVASVTLRRRDIVEGSWRKPALLDGATIVEVRRHGKNLALVSDTGRALGVHLGMTGQLLCLARGARAARTDHVHAEWRLRDGGRLLFRDPRRFGGLATFENEAAMRAGVWGRLGPDAATVTGGELLGTLGASMRAVKAGLLDQAAVAGIGNIYADESLFAAGIHPLTPCCGLSEPDWERLAREVRRVLAEAIEAGGSTLRDYRDATGAEGWFQTRHLVYGRGGLPCERCGRPLDRLTVAQRTTAACRSCQPIPVRPN